MCLGLFFFERVKYHAMLVNKYEVLSLYLQMSSDLWKKIGIKKNSSSEQNFSEGSTQNLVRCLDNLKHYPQNQELGIYSSEPIKKINHAKRTQKVNNEKTMKRNKQDLLIEYCQSESADSNKNDNRVEDKQRQNLQLSRNLINIRQFLRNLRLEHNLLRQIITKQFTQTKNNMLQTTFNQLSSKIKNSLLHQDKAKISENKDNEKCVKCKNSQKLVQILTKQCWTLEVQLKQITDSCKHPNTPSPKSSDHQAQQQKDKLIKTMKQSIILMQRQKVLLGEEIAIKKAKINELQLKNSEMLIYFKEQIDQLKTFAQKKIEQLGMKNRNLQAKLQFMDEKYTHLQSKYQMVKQLNMSMEIQKNTAQNASKLYRSSKFLDPNGQDSKSNKKYNSEVDQDSIIENKNPFKQKSMAKATLKPNFLVSNIQYSTHYEPSLSPGGGLLDAFEKLDQLKRQVQRKIKVSKIRAK